MSIMDLKLELADNAALSSAGISVGSTVLDLGNLAARDLKIGPGTPLYLNIRIVRAITGPWTTGDTSCSFKVQSGVSSVSSGSYTGQAFKHPIELLTAGYWIARAPLDYNVSSQRYLRLNFVKRALTTVTLTAGSYNAWISSAVPDTDVGT